MPDAKFLVCLTEKSIPACMENDACFDRIILSKDMWNGNFNRFIFKHAIVEASTAVKGQFFRFLFSAYPAEDCFIYLDPDCYVYGPFDELKEALAEAPIVLCPHLLHPGNIDMELSSTAHGVYNLGFLAVTNSPEAFRMIDWWAERLYLFCYDDIVNGVFTDQKWIDLVPCFFDAKIMHHYGYDLAPWGLLGCQITEENGIYYAQGQPIRFVHYSGFGPVAEQCMDKWLDENSGTFRKMYSEYARIHDKNDEDGISETVWSYSTFENGEPIPLEIRTAYRKDWDFMFSVENPFRCDAKFFYKHLPVPSPSKMSKIKQSFLYIKFRNAGITWRTEGFSGFVRKCLRKVLGK